MNIEDLLKAIRSRRREEWLEFYREKFIDARIWVQEHGERASIGALVLGVFLVLAFRFIISLFLLCGLAAVVIYFLADSSEGGDASS